jgi:hypothetical protein
MGGTQARTFFELLNTPIAVLMVLVVVVALNAFLFFGHYLPNTSSAPTSDPVLVGRGI